MNSLRTPHYRPAASWMLALVAVGYPVAGLLASALNLDSLLASVPLRVGMLALAFWMLFSRVRKPHARYHWALVTFAGIYLLRLLWDSGVAGIPGAPAALVFFCVTVLLPAWALMRRAGELDQVLAARLILRTGAAVCVTALAMHVFGIGHDRSLTEATGRLSFEALNPITLGHAAVSTLIAAMCLGVSRLRGLDVLILPLGALAAMVTLSLSGSRGPLICLGVVAVVFVLASGRWQWLLLLAAAGAVMLLDADSLVVERLVMIEEDDSALERLVLQGSAISAFMSSPILGSAFVEPLLLSYPHNLFIETAMALGVLGLLVLLSLLYRCTRTCLQEMRERRLLVLLLFVQYLVAAQFSGALYGHAALWGTLALLSVRTFQRRSRLVSVAASDHPLSKPPDLLNAGSPAQVTQ